MVMKLTVAEGCSGGLGRGQRVPEFLDYPPHSVLVFLGVRMGRDGYESAVSEGPVQGLVVMMSTLLDGNSAYRCASTSDH